MKNSQLLEALDKAIHACNDCDEGQRHIPCGDNISRVEPCPCCSGLRLLRQQFVPKVYPKPEVEKIQGRWGETYTRPVFPIDGYEEDVMDDSSHHIEDLGGY